MDSKKYKTSLGIILVLTTISVGLFGYQNFYYGKKQAKNKTIIYIANKDIQAKTEVSESMFDAIEVPIEGTLKTYVRDISPFLGKELKGGVLKGEPLTSVRINAEEVNLNENLTLELQPDYVGAVSANDNIKVYVMLTDKQTGNVNVKVLFENKKISKPIENKENNSLVNINTPEVEGTAKLLVKVTDEELKNYYIAKATGKIIVSKVTEMDLNKITSEENETKGSETAGKDKNSKDFNPNSEETKNSYRPSDNKDNSIAVMSYTLKKEDTIDSLCVKFKTTKDSLYKLNNDKIELKAGEVIVVPAI